MTHSKGFTLLEILVAMAIFTLIGIASNTVLSTVLDSDELSTERFEKLQKLQRAMLLIERDMLQAVNRPIRIEGESNEIVLNGGLNAFESDADGVGFVRAGWQNPNLMLPRSTLQAVAYRMQENQLQRIYGNYVDNVIGAEPRIKVLLEDIEDFQIQFYLDQQDANGDSKWGDVYTGVKLPNAIAVEISTVDFGTIRREFNLATEAAP